MQHKLIEVESFVERQVCPACRSAEHRVRSYSTVFPLSEPFPGGNLQLGRGVQRERKLLECNTCSLWYYSHVPSKELLKSLLEQPSLPSRWPKKDRRGFADAREALARYNFTSGCILDIGAHTGGFLDTVNEGWAKTALDPMVSSSTGIANERVQIINSFIEDADLPASHFDCITAFDVFEHLQSPEAAMSQIATALKPGGIAIIETGSTESFGARMFSAGWYYLSLLEHYQAFSPDSLTYLGRQHGLVPLDFRRVFHDTYRPNEIAFQIFKSVGYSALTIGGKPDIWRGLWSYLRPNATATPPITGAFEADHLFAVLQKPTNSGA